MFRSVVSVLILFILLSCSNSSGQKKITFSPKESRKYYVELTSPGLNLWIHLTSIFDQNKDSVFMRSRINQIECNETDSELNEAYQQYVNTLIENVYDKNGKMFNKSHDVVVNTDLLVVQFPETAVKVDDSWIAIKSARPDVFFKNIDVVYTCREIKEDAMVIDVRMKFVANDDAGISGLKITKKYDGYYIVNNDGTVREANLTISGYNGFSNINGTLKINHQ